MTRSLVVAVLLSSLSAFPCGRWVYPPPPPTEGGRLLMAARKALNAQKFAAAYELAEAAAKQELTGPQSKWADRVHGEALLGLGRPKEALAWLYTVRSTFERDPSLVAHLAEAELQTGDDKGAARLERLHTEQTLPDAEAWFWLAKSRQAHGAISAALAAAHQAARLDSIDPAKHELVTALRARTPKGEGVVRWLAVAR